MIIRVVLITILLLFNSSVFPGEVSLTIDDLPFVGSTNGKGGRLRREKRRFTQVLQVLEKDHVPASGFVVAGAIESKQWQLLKNFYQAGNIIANHTYSHPNLNRTSATKYIANIRRATQRLKPLLSTPKYFRYPFLAEGRGKRKYEVKHYLESHGYVIVPVTIDSKDFRFNQRFLHIHWRRRNQYLNSFRKKYINYIWRQTKRAERNAMSRVHRPIKQILLIHMNTLNSYFIQDIIDLYRQHGYRFISLPEAMKDPYYKKYN